MSQLSFLLNKLCYKRDISLLKIEFCFRSLKKFIKFNFTKNFQSETKICEIPHCETVNLTKYFYGESKLFIFPLCASHHTVWNFANFCLTFKIFREIEFDEFLQTSVAKFGFYQ